MAQVEGSGTDDKKPFRTGLGKGDGWRNGRPKAEVARSLSKKIGPDQQARSKGPKPQGAGRHDAHEDANLRLELLIRCLMETGCHWRCPAPAGTEGTYEQIMVKLGHLRPARAESHSPCSQWSRPLQALYFRVGTRPDWVILPPSPQDRRLRYEKQIVVLGDGIAVSWNRQSAGS